MTLMLDLPPLPPSPLSRLDPRWKLAALTIAAGVAAALQTLPMVIVAVAAALFLTLLARLPPRWVLVRLVALVPILAPFLLFLPFLLRKGDPWTLGTVTVYSEGVRLALVLSGKAAAMVAFVLVILATAPLNVTLHAAHSLKVPGLLIQLVLLTYRYVFLLADEFARLRIALRARGYRNRANRHSYRTIGHVTGTLLVRSQERAERVGQAMRCRGFDGRFRSLAVFRTTAADVVFFVLVAGGSAVMLLFDAR